MTASRTGLLKAWKKSMTRAAMKGDMARALDKSFRRLFKEGLLSASTSAGFIEVSHDKKLQVFVELYLYDEQVRQKYPESGGLVKNIPAGGGGAAISSRAQEMDGQKAESERGRAC